MTCRRAGSGSYPGRVPILVYSVLRLGLFGICALLLVWAGMGSWLAVVLAAFLAWGLSYVLLAGPRDRAALQLAARAERRAAGHRFSVNAEEDAAIEDAVVDAAAVDAAALDAAALDAAVEVGGEAGLEGEAEPEQDAVGELEQAGHPQDGDEQPAAGAGEHRDAEHHDGR